MTTRRTVLAGLASLPVAAGASPCAAQAASSIGPVTEPAPEPDFVHEIDRRLWNDLDMLEKALTRAKAALLAANREHPLVRSANLFDMRCTFQTVTFRAQSASEIVLEQRRHEQDAVRLWQAREVTS